MVGVCEHWFWRARGLASTVDDADLAATVGGLEMASLMNNGQACVAQTRILAPRSRCEETVDAVTGMVSGLKVGDPRDPATQVGPLVARRQQDRVEGYIKVGQEEGAKIVTGGSRASGQRQGWYVAPTQCSLAWTTRCTSPARRSSARCSR